MRKFCFFSLFVFLLLTACAENDGQEAGQQSDYHSSVEEKASEWLTPSITVAAVGDVLIHDRVYDGAWNGERYDFQPMLEEVKPFLSEPSITMANQETIMGGEELGLSGYPQFNSPYEIGADLQDAGVDMVTMANNHTLDAGEEAIQNAISQYEQIGMPYTGAFKSEADQDNIRVLDTEQGISIAFLSYTYGTNGIPVPTGKDYLVNFLDREQMADEVERAEDLADITIVSIHAGQEEQRTPNQEQRDWAQYAADLGVEVVIGHHPHVLQPVEWLEGKDGQPTLAAYSLGNFLSGQYQFYNRIGGVLQFDVVKEDNQTRIEAPRFLSTFVEFEEDGDILRDLRVVPLEAVAVEQMEEDPEQTLTDIEAHMSQYMPSLEFIRKGAE
ncbi:MULTISPECIES: CapA family protein [Gracilibacillus]|uniref:CapA family protein n=1 Tax=Gracilibacillus TaxID=74385 RepID=UPI0008242920|nr:MULTISPECIES: CapA family protein [Gracilibacillus]